MSVRERLEGKKRRSAVFPVALVDPSAATVELEQEAVFLKAAQARDLKAGTDAPSQATLDAQVAYDGALERFNACYEQVDFNAMEPDEFEALIGEHLGDDGLVDPADFRHVLAAACAADESLQDADWWAEQLSSPQWAHGEREELYALLWQLNHSSPRGRLGKD